VRYRVEQLAAVCEVSVDTVRYYQSRSLLPQPEREGRVAWYDELHADRIRRIAPDGVDLIVEVAPVANADLNAQVLKMNGVVAIYAASNDRGYVLPFNGDGTITRGEALPPLPDPGQHIGRLRLSPDGSKFVDVGWRPATISITTSAVGGTGDIWLYSLLSKSYEKIADNGSAPDWLPDGKHVLFVSNSQMFVVDIASKQVRPVPLPRPIRGFSVSPDGRALYLDERTAEADIWLMSPR